MHHDNDALLPVSTLILLIVAHKFVKAVSHHICLNVTRQVVFFEETITHPLATMQSIFDFLGIDLIDRDGRGVSSTQPTFCISNRFDSVESVVLELPQ